MLCARLVPAIYKWPSCCFGFAFGRWWNCCFETKNQPGHRPCSWVIPRGVVIQAHPDQLPRFRPAAEALVSALRDLDIEAWIEDAATVANSNPNAVHVLIGR